MTPACASNERPRIAVAQIGARRDYAVPLALEQLGCLEGVYTDLCANSWPWPWVGALWPRRLQPGALRRLLSRRMRGIPASKLHVFPWLAAQIAVGKARLNSPADEARFWAKADVAFARRVVATGLPGANGIWGTNLAAKEIFEFARQRGLATVLDQVSLPLQTMSTLLDEEHGRWPHWVTDADRAVDTSFRADRERAEWELADVILCGSTWVRDSIANEGGPAERCEVIPYAASRGFYAAPPRQNHGGPLRALFVGNVSLIKGVPYLLQAAARLKPSAVEIRVVGKAVATPAAVREVRSRVDYVGPVPHSEVAEHYAWADVFVLPSITEGSAVVAYEALAMGLPVIATRNAGTVVRDGIDGFVVPPRDPEALADRLMRFADDRPLLDACRRHALEQANRYTDATYRDSIGPVLEQLYRRVSQVAADREGSPRQDAVRCPRQ